MRALETGNLEHHNVIGVEIRGQLWAQPVPLELLVRTEIDLETGQVEVADLAPTRVDVMDPRLLHYYNHELQHLREMGAEFAQQFPKIAARLGMSGLEVADPYVERLLEGVGFLAARVQLKLDAEFPRFTQPLLEIVYPHYLAPTPSMLVAQLQPDKDDPSLAGGARTVPRGTALHALAATRRRRPACEFRTAHDVTLWPIEIAAAELLLVRAGSAAQRAAGRAADQGRPAHPAADDGGPEVRADRSSTGCASTSPAATTSRTSCYELCLGDRARRAGAAGRRPRRRMARVLPPAAIQPVGFDDEQALLPVTVRSFQGYRLLQEYFAFPQRFRFVELAGLAPSVARVRRRRARAGGPVRARRPDARERGRRAQPRAVLHAGDQPVPEAARDRIHVTDSTHEFHVVADRTRPMDFEVYEVDRRRRARRGRRQRAGVPAVLRGVEHRRRAPASRRTSRRGASRGCCRRSRSGAGRGRATSAARSSCRWSTRRRRRIRATCGSSSIQALCTNRDLPLQMPIGLGQTDFTLDIARAGRERPRA